MRGDRVKGYCDQHEGLKAQLNRIEGKTDALLILHKADPAEAVKPNPGGANGDYLIMRLKDKSVKTFLYLAVSSSVISIIIVGGVKLLGVL